MKKKILFKKASGFRRFKPNAIQNVDLYLLHFLYVDYEPLIYRQTVTDS